MRLLTALLVVGSFGCNACMGEGNGDVEVPKPILYDHRQFADSQDLSGLVRGAHVVEFDVYSAADGSMSWTPEVLAEVDRSIRIAHAPSGSRPSFRVTYSDERRRPDIRRLRIEMVLTESGTYVIDLRSSEFRPAHRRDLYNIDDSANLPEPGDMRLAYTPILLRTVGVCPHVTRWRLENGPGDERVLAVRFSESFERSALRAARNGMPLPEVPHDPAVATFQLPRDSASGQVSVNGTALAGRFGSADGCTAADFVIKYPELAPYGEWVTASPLYELVEAAFPIAKK